MEGKNLIKELRKNVGLTQEEFSKKIDLSRGALALIETNRSKPSVTVYEKISEVFGVNLIGTNNKIVMNGNNFIRSDENKLAIKDIGEKFHLIRILYDDNLKTLFFLTSILNSNNNEFSKKEIKELKMFESIEDMLSENRFENSIESTLFENIERIVKIHMFRSISNYMDKVNKLLGIETEYSFDLLKAKKGTK